MYCWVSANCGADWAFAAAFGFGVLLQGKVDVPLLWESAVAWYSLAYNILLSFGKSNLPLLASSCLKRQIKLEGHSMKISHSLQCKMFWPRQAGLNMSAACQKGFIAWKTWFKKHRAPLVNITLLRAATSIIWKVIVAPLKTFVTIHFFPPHPCLKGQQNPTGAYRPKCYSALYNSRTCFMILILTGEGQPYPRIPITIHGTREESTS